MRNTRTYTVAFGNKDNTLKSVTYHSSYEEAMSKAIEHKNLRSTDKHTLIQVGYGDNAVAMKYDTEKVSWVVTGSFWTKEEVHKQGNLARLTIPLTKTKAISREMRLRLHHGWEQTARHLFEQRFGVIFHTKVEKLTDALTPGDNHLRYECSIPEDSVKTLERSYGCSIQKVNLK